MSVNNAPKTPGSGTVHRQGSLKIDAQRSGHNHDGRLPRSPTMEEQKSLNMAESLNMRAQEADGSNLEDVNWYELRAAGFQPQRRGYHSTFIYQNK